MRRCDAIMQFWLHELPELRRLDLSGCKALTEISVLDPPRKLCEVDLTGCAALTQLPPLSSFEGLRILTLRGCVALENPPSRAQLTQLDQLVLPDDSS